jgi:hypothetical protein
LNQGPEQREQAFEEECGHESAEREVRAAAILELARRGSATPDYLASERQIAAILAAPLSVVSGWRNRRVGPPFIELEGGLIRYRMRDFEDWIKAKCWIWGEKRARKFKSIGLSEIEVG